MTTFLQLHLLTAYPPSNLNRDDTGRPKTARFGGTERLRISSQSLKRAYRTSDIFADRIGDHIGTRTKRMGEQVFQRLTDAGWAEDKAVAQARALAGQFGELEGEKDKDRRLFTRQLAHLSPEEITALDALVDRLIAGEQLDDDALKVLTRDHKAADIAMFGRMLAADPLYNRDAAVQVAHAITTNRVVVEDDYFTAVDELNKGDEDRGAGHVGEAEFGAGVFYLYICVDQDLLNRNLDGDESLAKASRVALAEAAATVAPRGKQASFASRAHASYVLAERGDRQPRSLAAAFLDAVPAGDQAALSIQALRDTRTKFDRAYGVVDETAVEMNVSDGVGTLAEVLDYVGR